MWSTDPVTYTIRWFKLQRALQMGAKAYNSSNRKNSVENILKILQS